MQDHQIDNEEETRIIDCNEIEDQIDNAMSEDEGPINIFDEFPYDQFDYDEENKILNTNEERHHIDRNNNNDKNSRKSIQYTVDSKDEGKILTGLLKPSTSKQLTLAEYLQREQCSCC